MTQCDIIRDLLPLYHDNACSPASRAMVEAHIDACEPCRAQLDALEAPAPLPPQVNAFLPSVNRLREAKRRLVRRAALSVTAVFCALGLFVTCGVSLYIAFEKERVLPWGPSMLAGCESSGSGIDLLISPERYLRASCLLRRVTIEGEQRDIAILQFTQTWARKYLDTNLSGPEKVAMGMGTGLTLSRGAQKHDVAYGPEYEPAYWDPRWVYPGELTAVYYLESPAPSDLKDAPEAEILACLEQNGALIWER